MSAPTRIVSLIASATEILCALGLRDRMIGRSHECDYPEGVHALPALSYPKVNPALAGRAIDRGVREIVRDGLSVYSLHVDLLEQLQPDLIVTQDQCEVCAVSLGDVEAALCQLEGVEADVCSLRPVTLADVGRDFERVAQAAGVPERGQELVLSFEQRLEHVRRSVPTDAQRPRVALIEWLDPLMLAGGWMPQLTHIAGGEPVLVTAPEEFREVTWQDLYDADPDLVVVAPCGFDVHRSLRELQDQAVATALRSVPAVQRRDCWVADGSALFNRPGPRLVETAALLAEIVHLGGDFGDSAVAARWR